MRLFQVFLGSQNKVVIDINEYDISYALTGPSEKDTEHNIDSILKCVEESLRVSCGLKVKDPKMVANIPQGGDYEGTN